MQITLKVSCFQSHANSATQLDLLVKQNSFYINIVQRDTTVRNLFNFIAISLYIFRVSAQPSSGVH
jgi:hypothetical protein